MLAIISPSKFTIITWLSQQTEKMITKSSLADGPKAQCIVALSVVSPTKEISCSQNVKDLIYSHSSYIVIPSTPTLLTYNTSEIILGTLPLTKNLLLDLNLPFYHRGCKESEQGFYFGRYLIFDQRLVGIKLSCETKPVLVKEMQTFKKWPSRKTSHYRIPKIVLDYYKKNNFAENTYTKEIIIGDFVLTLKNVRISLFFESELKQNINLLQDSKLIGSDIVSVVADLPREKILQSRLRPFNYNTSTVFQKQLRQFAKNSSKIVMYTGCKSAPSTELYLSNPFIFHNHQVAQVKMEPYFLNKGGAIAILSSIQISKKEFLQDKPAVIKQIPNLTVNGFLREVRQSLQGKRKSFYPQSWGSWKPVPQQMDQLLKKMHLWYFYNTINECEPFIIPLPLEKMTEMIVKQFKQIANFLERPLSVFISFYKSEKEQLMDEQNPQVKIYGSLTDLIAQQKRQRYLVYTSNPKQILFLTHLAQQNSRVYICQKQIFMEEQILANRQISNIEKRIADFAKRIIDMEYFSLKRIYKENKASIQPLTKDQLLVAVNENLKNVIRSSYRAHPFYNLMLELNRNQLQQAFGDIEVQLQKEEKANSSEIQNSNGLNKSFNASEGSNNRDKHSKNTEFNLTLESLKRLYSEQKKISQFQCHRCQKFHVRQVVKNCEQCHLKTCYLCFQAIKREKATPENVEECVTCKRLCYCPLCLKKKKKLQKQKQRIQASSLQIQNLSLIYTEKTLEELQQLKLKKQFQNNACQICFLSGRQISHIKLTCTSCDNTKCFNCVKAESRGDRRKLINWECEKCRPQQIVNRERQLLQMVDQEFESKKSERRQPQFSPYHEQLEKRNGRMSSSKKIVPSRDSSSPARNHQNNQTVNQENTFNRKKNSSRSNSPKGRKLNSPSNSISPPRNRNNNNKRDRSPFHSKSPLPQQNPQKKNKFRSDSPVSPKIQEFNHKKRVNNRQQSRSPVTKRQNIEEKQQNQVAQEMPSSNRPRSPSHSNSPPRRKPLNNQVKIRPVSPSYSASLKLQHTQKESKNKRRRSSSSKSVSKGSRKNVRRSISNSRSRSRSVLRNRSPQQGQITNSDKLWGKKWNQRQDSNNHQDNRERQSNQRQQDRQFQNRDGGRGRFRGGYNSRGNGNQQKRYNNDRDRGNYNNKKQNNNRNSNNSQRDNGQQSQKNENRQIESQILSIEKRSNEEIDY